MKSLYTLISFRISVHTKEFDDLVLHLTSVGDSLKLDQRNVPSFYYISHMYLIAVDCHISFAFVLLLLDRLIRLQTMPHFKHTLNLSPFVF